jgi:hypothetical protein
VVVVLAIGAAAFVQPQTPRIGGKVLASVSVTPSASVPEATTSARAPGEDPGAMPAATTRLSFSPGEVALHTAPPGSGGADALGGGVLGGKTLNGVACFWFDQPGSTDPANRVAIGWPFGFRAFVNPLRIVGPDGEVLARVGDLVEAGGGGAPPGEALTPAQDPCGIGRFFAVGEVAVAVGGRRMWISEGSLALVTRPKGMLSDCPAAPLEPLMLVMSDSHLRLRLIDPGVDVDAIWPAGFSAIRPNNAEVLDAGGRLVIEQGREVRDARGVATATGLAICGIGEKVFP